MRKSISGNESPEPTKGTLGKCPHCSDLVDGFKIDAQSRDDVVITLKPCGCVSESNDDRFSHFVELVDASGSLKPVPKEIAESARQSSDDRSKEQTIGELYEA